MRMATRTRTATKTITTEKMKTMKRTLKMLVGIGVMLSGLLAWSQNSTPAKSPMPLPRVSASYVIGPDDTLFVSVWKEPDLTNSLPVRADGMISMPLLNDVQAAGLTPMQLGDAITDKLKKFISDPHVTVVVTQMNSQRIYVTGEVSHSGAVPLLPDMTVLQALAGAGFTQFANTKGIYVLRTENGTQKRYPVNYKKLVKGEVPEQNIFLKPGDTIVVP
jgi:polysaccharide export outer membrane protein